SMRKPAPAATMRKRRSCRSVISCLPRCRAMQGMATKKRSAARGRRPHTVKAPASQRRLRPVREEENHPAADDEERHRPPAEELGGPGVADEAEGDVPAGADPEPDAIVEERLQRT